MFYKLTAGKFLMEGSPPNLSNTGPFVSVGSIVEDDPPSGQTERLSPDGKFRKVKFRTAGGNVQRGWLPVEILTEAAAAERPPIVLWGFLTTCVRAEEWINKKQDTGSNFINADYLIALAIYESKIANIGNETPGTDAVGPFQITSARWREFLDKVDDPEFPFTEDDRDNVSDQIYGAAFLTREDTRAISEAITGHGLPAGTNPAEIEPYVPTYSDVFIASVVSPLAAITLRKLQLEGKDDMVVSVLVEGLAPDRKAEMERIFRHNHHILKVDKAEAEAKGVKAGPRTVRDFYAVVDEKLNELLVSAFKLIQENVPELLPVAPVEGAAWLPIALREQTDPWKNGQLKENSAAGTQRVIEYFGAIGVQTNKVLHWCGAFVGFCMKEAGGELAGSIVKEPGFAKSWKTWGNQSIPVGTKDIPTGAMVVMSAPPDGKTTGHVAFCSPNQSGTAGMVTLIGGNQSDSVKDSDFERSKIAAIRWLGSPLGTAGDGTINDVVPPGEGIAWGKFVDKKFGSAAFKKKVIEIGGRLRCDPNFLMAAMAFETGRSFSAKQKNLAGGSATGLIQFMPTTAAELGTSTAALAAMTEIKQLDFVEKYMARKANGRPFARLSDVYMAILFPVAFGKSAGTAIFKHPEKAYKQNSGLDINGDKKVTVGEATAKVAEQLEIGLRPENRG